MVYNSLGRHVEVRKEKISACWIRNLNYCPGLKARENTHLCTGIIT